MEVLNYIAYLIEGFNTCLFLESTIFYVIGYTMQEKINYNVFVLYF